MDSLAIVSYRNWERYGDQFPAKMEAASVNTVLVDVDRGDNMVVHVRSRETRIPVVPVRLYSRGKRRRARLSESRERCAR